MKLCTHSDRYTINILYFGSSIAFDSNGQFNSDFSFSLRYFWVLFTNQILYFHCSSRDLFFTLDKYSKGILIFLRKSTQFTFKILRLNRYMSLSCLIKQTLLRYYVLSSFIHIIIIICRCYMLHKITFPSEITKGVILFTYVKKISFYIRC